MQSKRDHKINPLNILQKKYDKLDLLVNQPITIREIIIDSANSHGEFDNAYMSGKKNRVLRLAAHIELIAILANQAHEDLYVDKTSRKIREDSVNKITRASLAEFALYTHKSPLSHIEFIELITHIEAISKKLYPNLHLLLGTIAVEVSDLERNKSVINYGIYVECSASPIIHTFAKNTLATDVDLEYENRIAFERPCFDKDSYPLLLKNFNPVRNPVTAIVPNHLSAEKSSTNSICTESIFTAETFGGALFTIVCEICLDHLAGFGVYAFRDMRMLLSSTKNSFIPKQWSHVVISNTCEIEQASLVTNKVTHIDPEGMAVYPEGLSNKKIEFKELTFSSTDITHINKNFRKYKIRNNEVINPPFGEGYRLKIAESELSLLNTGSTMEEKQYLKLVKNINERTFEEGYRLAFQSFTNKIFPICKLISKEKSAALKTSDKPSCSIKKNLLSSEQYINRFFLFSLDDKKSIQNLPRSHVKLTKNGRSKNKE